MDERVFKRIHIFRGFVRTTRDYKEAVGYHLVKGRLHNRYFHHVGVVSGVAGELKVRARRRPEMMVEVRPGYALDPSGQDVLVREVELKGVVKEDFVLPRTIYLVLRYQEEETDYRQIRVPGFPEMDGHARISESYRVDWTIAEPDVRRELELCRILLTEDTVSLRNAEDPNDPKPGEIDLRWVRRAGVCGRPITGMSFEELRASLLEAIRTNTYMARTRQMPSSQSVATSLVGFALLNDARALDEEGYLRCMALLSRVQAESIQEAQSNEPALAHRKMFRDYIGKAEASAEVLGALEELAVNERAEAARLSTGFAMEGVRALHGLIQPPRVVASSAMSEMVPRTGLRVLDGTDWERLKVESRMPALSMVVEGREWRLIDEVNLLDGESEQAHNFAIHEAVDWWRSQVSLKYPDGAVVADEGIGHKGGHSVFEVHNVTPGLPLVIMRRMDYARGDYWCRVWVNDVEAGEVPCLGEDTRYRWRNWPFWIHPHFVRHRVVRVKQAIETANRDVNFFKLWFYQPV